MLQLINYSILFAYTTLHTASYPWFCPGLLECLHFFQPNSLFHGQNHNFFFIFHNFMVKINTFFFFADWWSGPTSADRQGQGQNTGYLCTFSKDTS
jgi:hypothetical protein